MTLRIAVLVLASLAGGCAAPGGPVVDFYSADAESLMRYRAMQVVDDADQRPSLQSVGEVQGYFCRKGLIDRRAGVHSDVAQLEAIDQVKLKAAQQGFSYIGKPSCETSDKSDWVRNCTGTVICTADVLTPIVSTR